MSAAAATAAAIRALALLPPVAAGVVLGNLASSPEDAPASRHVTIANGTYEPIALGLFVGYDGGTIVVLPPLHSFTLEADQPLTVEVLGSYDPLEDELGTPSSPRSIAPGGRHSPPGSASPRGGPPEWDDPRLLTCESFVLPSASISETSAPPRRPSSAPISRAWSCTSPGERSSGTPPEPSSPPSLNSSERADGTDRPSPSSVCAVAVESGASERARNQGRTTPNASGPLPPEVRR